MNRHGERPTAPAKPAAKGDPGSGLGATPCSRFYVWHPEAADLGLGSPKFPTYAEARAKADEWNKEVGGHKVLEITEANSQSLPPADTTEK